MVSKLQYYHKRTSPRREMLLFWKEFEGCSEVLDVGCGIGSFGQHTPSYLPHINVFGIDNDADAVKIAGKYEFASVGDLDGILSYKNVSFDGILAKDVLEHVNEPWKLVSEMKRVLRIDGIIIATVPSPGAKAWDDYTHVRPFTKRSITELFLDQGFKVEYVRPLCGIPGAGVLGLTNVISVFLRIPLFSLLTRGYKIKAVKRDYSEV